MPDPSKPQSSVSPSALRLAQRFGVSPQAMEEIISSTARESAPNLPPVSFPQQASAEEPSIQSIPQERPSTILPTEEWMKEHTFAESTTSTPPVVAEAGVVPTIASVQEEAHSTTPVMAAETPTVQPPIIERTVEEPVRMGPQASPTRVEKRVREEREERKGLSPLAVILGVIGILAIVGLIWYFSHLTRSTKPQPAAVPSVKDSSLVSSDSLAKSDSLNADSLESLASQPPPATEPAQPKAKAARPKTAKAKSSRPAKPRGRASNAPYLITTSSLTAQEQLAEMRAEGNRTAWIEAVEKNGIVTYKLHKTPRKAKR